MTSKRARWDPELRANYIPLGKHRIGTTLVTPEAVRYMRVVIRERQRVEADYQDEIGGWYDWKNELVKRWMPDTRNVKKIQYNPWSSYRGKRRSKRSKGSGTD